MTTTRLNYFHVYATRLAKQPHGRNRSARHWTFTIVGTQSGATYQGIYSAGEAITYTDPTELATAIKEAVSMDSHYAVEGQGNIRATIAHLIDSFGEMPAPDVYDMAADLVAQYEWLKRLTKDERADLDHHSDN